MFHPAEHPFASGLIARIFLCPGVHLDRCVVRFPGRSSPGDQAVLFENHTARLGVTSHSLGHLARQAEAGPAVRDPDRVLPEDRLDMPLSIDRVGQGQNGVGVGVIDVRVWNEAVQERLD